MSLQTCEACSNFHWPSLYLANTIFVSSILLMSLISARFLSSLDIWDRNFQYPLRGSFGHDSSVVVRQGTLSQIVVVCLQDVSMSLDTERCQEDRTGLLRSEIQVVDISFQFAQTESYSGLLMLATKWLEWYDEWSMMLDGLIANWGTFIAALMCLGGLVEMLVDFWISPQPWQQSPWFLDHFKVSNSCKMWLPCELWRFSLQSQNLRWVWYLWRSTTREGEFLKSGGCQAFKSSPSIFEIKMLQNWGHKLIHYKHLMHMKSHERWPLVHFWCKKKAAHGSSGKDDSSQCFTWRIVRWSSLGALSLQAARVSDDFFGLPTYFLWRKRKQKTKATTSIVTVFGKQGPIFSHHHHHGPHQSYVVHHQSSIIMMKY